MQPRGLTAVLATAVVFWTASTLGLEALGTFGAISLGPMLAWTGMILGVGGVIRWLRALRLVEIYQVTDRLPPFPGTP